MMERIVSHLTDIPRMSRLMIMPMMGPVRWLEVASFTRFMMSSPIPTTRRIPKIMLSRLYTRGLYRNEYASILNHLTSISQK